MKNLKEEMNDVLMELSTFDLKNLKEKNVNAIVEHAKDFILEMKPLLETKSYKIKSSI